LPQCSKVTFASVLALKKMNAIRNRKTMPTLEANFAVKPNLSRLWKYLYDLSQHAPQAPQDHGNPYYTLGIPPLATVRHEIDFHPFHGPSARDLSDL
jgi:hypothetical protein